MPKIYRVQSVSFPDERLLAAAQVEAKTQRRSLSNYVCGLIEDDLGWNAEKADAAERQTKPKTAARTPARASRGASSAAVSADAGVLAAAALAPSSRPAKSRRK